MKSLTNVVPIVLFLSALIMLVSCQQQKAEWKGKIEEVDGVTVVKNPKEPLYGEDVCVIEEELSIGETEGKEEYIFSEIMDIAVDNEERIYVLDKKEPFVRVFNKSGDLEYYFGRIGQGPGELQSPTLIQITSQNELSVYDRGNRRFTFFTLDGIYIRQLISATIPGLILAEIDSQGNIIGENMIGLSFELKKYNSELKPLYSIFNIDIQKYWAEYRLMFPFIFFALTKDDRIVWGCSGCSNRYEIHVLNLKGGVISKIIKEYTPIKITEERKNDYIDFVLQGSGIPPGMKVKFPEFFYPFVNISVDEEDRVIVGTYEKFKDKKGHYVYDVFDLEGKYIAKMPLKIRPEIKPKWNMGKLYAIDSNEDRFPEVKRYKVTWKY